MGIKSGLLNTKNIWQCSGSNSQNKTTVALNKSTYVRMCILKLSKVTMHQFHYDYLKNKYGNKSR